MIAFLRGILFNYSDESIIIDVNGIGYEVLTHSRSFARLPAKGKEILVYTHLQMLENELKLYGFLAPNELELFKLLLGVSGIGARGALNVLAAMDPEQFYHAVAGQDEKSLITIPGIGKKTAQRLIFELKEKIEKPLARAGDEAGDNTTGEVLEAMETLGYSRSEILPLIVELKESGQFNDKVEIIIKKILKARAEQLRK